MAGGRVCVGGLTNDGESVRLMNQNCSSNLAQNSPYQVGEWWDVEFASCGEQRPPHIEDVAVTAAKRIGEISDITAFVSSVVKPWQGCIDCLFDGKIQFTGPGAGYISEPDIPSNAIGFWVPDRGLKLEQDYRERSGYYPDGDIRHLNYVGVEAPIRRIEPGRLVRVSLARWWRPENADPGFELRCYAQLSGWY
jgi:hypothetical protein